MLLSIFILLIKFWQMSVWHEIISIRIIFYYCDSMIKWCAAYEKLKAYYMSTVTCVYSLIKPLRHNITQHWNAFHITGPLWGESYDHHDCLIFTMRFPTLVTWHLYIKTAPGGFTVLPFANRAECYPSSNSMVWHLMMDHCACYWYGRQNKQNQA